MGKKISESQFLNIPHFILFNKELDGENKILLSDIFSLSQLPKGCYKSQNGFGAIVNLDRSTISQRLEALRVNGFITMTKIRPELKNSRKRYELNIDRFFQEKEVDKPTIQVHEVVEELTSLVDEQTITSLIENYVVVEEQTTSSLPDNIYNNNTSTIKNNNELLQEKNEISAVQSSNINSGMSMAQFARNNIKFLEDKIITATERGWEIVQNVNYSTIKNLGDYISNRREYELVLPLLKDLISEKRRLAG